MHRRDFLRAAGAATLAVTTPETSDAGFAELPATESARSAATSNSSARESALMARTRARLSLDQAWRFHLGDIPFPRVIGHGWTYANAKAGNAGGAAAENFDDSTWRELDLPHDWVVEGPFDSGENPSQGYRRRGVAWYRRALRLDSSDRGKHLELQFDGIATHATVWFNGTVVSRNWSGYNSIYIDITPFARYGNRLNNIVVRVDADAMEGWWYEGGGIYRHVWLMKRSAFHIVSDGVCAQPRRNSDGSWILPVESALRNCGAESAQGDLAISLLDGNGNAVGQARASVSAAPLSEVTVNASVAVTAPDLWSIDYPALYRLSVALVHADAVVDESLCAIGFRTLRFDADKGFFLNEQPTKIKGVCVHQDHAGVGVAVPDALWDFRLRRLKELGANAIRCAHNAPAVELLDAANRIGMLVMDENRNFNVSPDYMRQLEWLIRRDRNHPSIFLWSVFNEEPMQGTEIGYQMVRRMVAAVKALDTTRPVTAAMNDGMFSPINVSQAVDVVGFNYQQDRYDAFHAAHPQLPLLSSEDTCSFMTRGEYLSDRGRHVMTSYDEEPASWGATHRAAWKAIAARPFIAGGFVWSGFDYRGEPSPFEWPSASSFFGIMDLCGFPKAAFYLHQAHWIKDRPILQIVPHWNWPGREGQLIKVMVFTNAQSVALLLNDRLLERKAVHPIDMVSWQVPYAPGKLEAVAFSEGREFARCIVETTGPPVELRLTSDRASLAGDGRDAQPVMVFAVDAEGRSVPNANIPVEFLATGGRVIGLGNGDPNSHEPEKGSQRSLFNGLAQLIVQSGSGSQGSLRLIAKSPGLRTAEISIDVTAATGPPFVPRTTPVQTLSDWRVSPATIKRPSPTASPGATDMNSWGWSRGEELRAPLAKSGWTVFRTRFLPMASVRARGGRIVFSMLTGRAEVWLDGKQIGRNAEQSPATLSAALPPGEGERTLTVLVYADARRHFGLGDVVTVEP